MKGVLFFSFLCISQACLSFAVVVSAFWNLLYVMCRVESLFFLFREHIVLSCPRFSCILVFFFYLLVFMCLLMVEGCFFAKKQEF